MVCKVVANVACNNQLGFRDRERVVLGLVEDNVHCVHLQMDVISGLMANGSCRHGQGVSYSPKGCQRSSKLIRR